MKVIIAVALLMLVTSPAWAQHNHQPGVVVSGADHPELIPDSVAGLHWLLVVSQRDKGSAFLAPLKLTDQQSARVAAELKSFREQYDALVQQQHDAAMARKAFPMEEKIYVLVAAARLAIKEALPEKEAAKFEIMIQQHKRNMHGIVSQ